MEHGFNFVFAVIKDFGWLGNWLFFVITILECIPIVGSLLPSGSIIYLGAILAAQGSFNVWEIIIFAVAGSTIGDYLVYVLGRWGRGWLNKKNLIRSDWIEKGEVFFKKYGNKSILWGRFSGPVRAVVPFVAGATRMKQDVFFFWNFISAVAWTLFYVILGYFSGNILTVLIKKWSHRFGLIALVAVCGWLAYLLIRKRGQSFWTYFKRQAHIFYQKLLAGRWYAFLDERYPVVSEFSNTRLIEEKVFIFFIGLFILLILYIITLIL